jgi:hypothetical protein
MGENKNIFWFANIVSRALGHVHSLSDEEVSQVVSLRTLQLFWRLKGALYNDSEDVRRFPWLSGMEGWVEFRDENFGIYELRHRTGSGRLEVKVREERPEMVFLTFFAGPVEGSSEGRVVASFNVSFPKGEMEIWVSSFDRSLYDGREDRLDLLFSIDDAIGGNFRQALDVYFEKHFPALPVE